MGGKHSTGGIVADNGMRRWAYRCVLPLHLFWLIFTTLYLNCYGLFGQHSGSPVLAYFDCTVPQLYLLTQHCISTGLTYFTPLTSTVLTYFNNIVPQLFVKHYASTVLTYLYDTVTELFQVICTILGYRVFL